MPDDHSRRLQAATFGLGVAALAGIITFTGQAGSPAGKDTGVIAQAIAAASYSPADCTPTVMICTSPCNCRCAI